MKKNLLVILIILVLSILLSNNIVLGIKSTDINKKLQEWSSSVDNDKASVKNVVSDLQNYYGYDKSKTRYDEKVNLDTTITLKHKGWFISNLQIGTNDKTIIVSSGNLKKIYGYTGETTWKVALICSIETKEKVVGRGATAYVTTLTLNELYSGDDYINGKSQNVETGNKTTMEKEEEKYENTKKTIDNIGKFADGLIEFLKHPIGKPVKEMMDFIGPVVGDNIQWLANLFQTVPEYTSGDGEVLYSYSDLEDDSNEEKSTDTSSDKEKDEDKGKGNRNKYTNVAKSKEETKDSQAVFQVDVKKDLNNNNEADFSSTTKIPVIVGDLYNIAAGKIDFFDINFLTGNKERKSDGTLRHENDSIWNNLRKVVSLLTHISVYMASAIIILSLIWYGINMVRHTFDNPVAKMESMEGLKRFFTAVFMLIGTIIIMALCIFGSKVFFDLLNKNDSYELPIRVNVEDQYSFSTTPTGYVRYMSLTEDIEEPLQKFVYTIVYIVLAAVNLFVMVIMFARTIVIWVLSIVGPMMAVLYVFNAGGTITFRRWVGVYLRASLIQIFVSIIYIAIFKAVIAVM